MRKYFLLLLFISIVSSLQTIAIIGTNDIHGSALPTALRRSDNQQKYTYGGMVYMARLIQILQEEFTDNTIYLDAGDQFQGGLESSKLISNGEIMNDFYNTMNLQGSAIGNHQFDFGPDFLLPYMQNKGGEGVNLAANLRSQNGQINFLPKQKPSKLFAFPSGIKVGVIGLATLETPTSTSGFSSGKFPPYQFLQYKRFVEDESQKLRKAGANAVLILSHVGDRCEDDIKYRSSWDAQTSQNPCDSDEMSQLLRSLSKGVIDGVVQGHRHRIVHRFINDIPYMGVINGGYYLHVMYLTFDDNFQIVNKTIEGPIPVCEKIFENTGRCNYLSDEQLTTAGNLVNWKFHNKDVYAHEQLNQIYTEKWLPLMEKYLVDLVDNELSLYKIENAESPLGNLMTTLVHEAVPSADFVILNPGGFRTEWFPGIVQYQHFYNMFPFDNKLLSFKITGQQLLDTLKIIQDGKNGFYHAWNILMEVTYNPNTNQKRFVSAKLTNGTEIDPESQYTGVTIDFLLEGGDDFKQVINVVYSPRDVNDQGDFKTLVQPKLVQLGSIQKSMWLDPNNPRIIIDEVNRQ